MTIELECSIKPIHRYTTKTIIYDLQFAIKFEVLNAYSSDSLAIFICCLATIREIECNLITM